MVAQMLAPPGRSAMSLSKETGISQSSLSRWLRESAAVHDSVATVGKESERKGNKWTVREKMRVVLASEGLKGEELGALLRREGIHQSDLDAWRQLGESEEVDRSLTKQEKQRLKMLEKELRRKDKALAEAAALLVLQKKLQTVLAAEDGDTKENDDE